MNKLITLLMLFIMAQACSTNNASIFELSPQQSMSITGKGIGQDAAFNPFGETKSIAIVKSKSENPFTIRVQFNGEVIENIEVSRHEIKEVVLEKEYELYLDSKLASKAQVKFRPYDK